MQLIDWNEGRINEFTTTINGFKCFITPGDPGCAKWQGTAVNSDGCHISHGFGDFRTVERLLTQMTERWAYDAKVRALSNLKWHHVAGGCYKATASDGAYFEVRSRAYHTEGAERKRSWILFSWESEDRMFTDDGYCADYATKRAAQWAAMHVGCRK